MQDELVTYETAKLAKQKGFNIPTFNVFDKELDLIKPISIFTLKNGKYSDKKLVDWNSIEKELKTDYELYSAPTQSLLQRWLREVHNIFINVELDGTSQPKFCYSIFKYSSEKIEWTNCLFPRLHSDLERTYEDSLELGLQKALNLLSDVEL